MKSLLSLCVVALFVVATLVGSSNAQYYTPETNVTGFAGIDFPLHSGENYRVRWARVRIETSPDSVNFNTSLRFEYDIAHQSVTYMFIRKTDSLAGGTLCLTLGRFITPTAQLYPGPSGLRTTRWAHAFDVLDVYAIGLHGTYQYKRAALHVSHTYEYWSASVKTGPLAVFWQDHAGYGAVFEPNRIAGLVKPVAIVSLDEGGKAQYSFRNYAQIAPRLEFNFIGDLGIVEAASVGLTYEYAKTSFAKLYLDFGNGDTPRFTAEVTRSF